MTTPQAHLLKVLSETKSRLIVGGHLGWVEHVDLRCSRLTFRLLLESGFLERDENYVPGNDRARAFAITERTKQWLERNTEALRPFGLGKKAGPSDGAART